LRPGQGRRRTGWLSSERKGRGHRFVVGVRVLAVGPGAEERLG